KSPTTRDFELDQEEPTPVTVTVPFEPAWLPMTPPWFWNVPPPWMVTVPVARSPTVRMCACAPAAPITVALGVTVSTVAFEVMAFVGPPAVQLPALNQSVEVVPVQAVCACDRVVAAIPTSAILDNRRAMRFLPRRLVTIFEIIIHPRMATPNRRW